MIVFHPMIPRRLPTMARPIRSGIWENLPSSLSFLTCWRLMSGSMILRRYYLVINSGSNVAISPGDPLYLNPDAPSQTNLQDAQDVRNAVNRSPNLTQPYIVGRGAFVDLGYAVQRSTPLAPRTTLNNSSSDLEPFGDANRISDFSGLPSFRDVNVIVGQTTYVPGEDRLWSPLLASLFPGFLLSGSQSTTAILANNPVNVFVYDTWTEAFERDGLDQDNDGDIDEARNELDDDNQNGVDDAGELESPPPYPVPLRGLEVRIRMWDVESGQVRQVSVVGDFTSR